MEGFDLYRDIAQRTGGDIYVGVVGPVRTGKSTFIKRFMDLMVLPNIEDEFVRARAVDELPQSGSGRTIMTTQPKFVPNEAVKLTLEKEGAVQDTAGSYFALRTISFDGKKCLINGGAEGAAGGLRGLSGTGSNRTPGK